MGRTKQKEQKDPNKPKRPTSAYFYFVASQREECKKKGQHISRVAEWTKEVSGKWKELSNAQKKPFEAQAAQDKKRYETEMAAYGGGRKRTKDDNKPKRPQSAYFLFLADFRSKQKDNFKHEGGHKDLIRAAGQAWNELSTVEKAPYEKKNEEEKKKYEAAMAAYKSGGSPAKKAKIDNGADDDDEDDDDEEEEEEEDDDDDEGSD